VFNIVLLEKSLNILYIQKYGRTYDCVFSLIILCHYLRDDVTDNFVIAVHRIFKAECVAYYINSLSGTAGIEHVYYYEF